VIPENEDLVNEFDIFVSKKQSTSVLLAMTDDHFRWDVVIKVSESRFDEFNKYETRRKSTLHNLSASWNAAID
jgi:hypothetical protein